MQAQTHRGFGWVPDGPDPRDHMYSAPLATLRVLPKAVDLRVQCPPVLDQGPLGSCTANAIANAHYFDQIKQNAAQKFAPSRLFVYYNERASEGSVGWDSGARIRDGVRAISKLGVCSETLWPYLTEQFTKKPSEECYAQALFHQALTYSRVTLSLSQMKGCLASGYPFVFGFTVFESFESVEVAASGVVPMPGASEAALGGHAVLCVGYDDTTQRFYAMNSWGIGWGLQGYFTIPYAYLTGGYASDLWTIRTVEA